MTKEMINNVSFKTMITGYIWVAIVQFCNSFTVSYFVLAGPSKLKTHLNIVPKIFLQVMLQYPKTTLITVCLRGVRSSQEQYKCSKKVDSD